MWKLADRSAEAVAGRVTYQFYYLRDAIWQGGVFSCIRKGDFQAVERYLDRGVSPDSVDELGRTLLETAIEQRRPIIAALLVYRDADPNKIRKTRYRDKRAADDVFLKERHCESLVKFLMTYNARYEHEHSPINTNSRFLKSLTYCDERYALYEAEQAANQALEQGNYPLAKTHLDRAVALLKQFADEEQEKLSRQAPGESKVDRTDAVFIQYYDARRQACLEKLRICEAKTAPANGGAMAAPAAMMAAPRNGHAAAGSAASLRQRKS